MGVVLALATDNTLTEHGWSYGNHERLRRLCELLDCHTVDKVILSDRLDMWVDDEGLLREGTEINDIATQIAQALMPDLAQPFARTLSQPLAGTVVFAGHDAVGATTAVPDDLRDLITRMVSYYARHSLD